MRAEPRIDRWRQRRSYRGNRMRDPLWSKKQFDEDPKGANVSRTLILCTWILRTWIPPSSQVAR